MEILDDEQELLLVGPSSEEREHALLAPSSADAWTECYAMPAMSSLLPEVPNMDAAVGTGMHDAGRHCLVTGTNAAEHVGTAFEGIVLTADAARTLQEGYIDPVREISTGGVLLVEQRLSIEHLTGEKNAKGTSDTVVLFPRKIIIADLKWGVGVQVFAERNKQLAMYALAAYEEYSLGYDFEEVTLMIFQPNLEHYDAWTITIDELLEMGEQIKRDAAIAYSLLMKADLPDAMFKPTESNCRFCKAKGNCAPQAKEVLTAVAWGTEGVSEVTERKEWVRHDGSDSYVAMNADDLALTIPADDLVNVHATAVPLAVREEQANNVGAKLAVAIEQAQQQVQVLTADQLAALMPRLGLIQAWCKSVKTAGERHIHAGGVVPGYKLVMGKQGNRKWADLTQAEATLKSMRLKDDEMYDKSIISPTRAEDLLKKDSPRRWKKLQPLITRAEGKPTVVPVSDKRLAIEAAPVADDFAVLTDETGDEFADLV